MMGFPVSTKDLKTEHHLVPHLKNKSYPFKKALWNVLGLALLGLTWVGVRVTAFASEPMMDSGIFGVSRMQATNQINEGRFREALLAEEKALRIAQNHVGPIHPSLVLILNDLASLHCYLAEYGKAEEEIKWGLALREKNFGLQDLSVADSKEKLGTLYNDLGRFQEAEILEKEVLTTRQENSLSTPSALAQSLEFLGKIELNLQNYSSAQTLIEKAIAVEDKNAHTDPILTLHLLNSQAETYRLEGLIPKTESALEGVLDFTQKNFPSNDIHVSDAMENLGEFYHSQNQDEKAKSLYESALKIDKPLVGTYMEYPALPYMKQLAKAYQGTDDPQAAEALWQNALKTEKGVFGLNHPQVAVDLMRLAEVEVVLGKQALAQEDLKQSIAILASLFKEGHPLLNQANSLLEKLSKN
jgi:tetratricopeptide (TPR) repeat protein